MACNGINIQAALQDGLLALRGWHAPVVPEVNLVYLLAVTSRQLLCRDVIVRPEPLRLIERSDGESPV